MIIIIYPAAPFGIDLFDRLVIQGPGIDSPVTLYIRHSGPPTVL
jgi:hypothetical protein